MRSEIGTKLKNFRRRYGISMPLIAAATGLPKESMYKWEKGTRPMDFEQVKKLEAFLEREERRLKATLAYDDAGAETEKDTIGIMIRSSQALVEVDYVVSYTDECMAPFYKPGCRLCLREVANPRKLIWGTIYYFADIHNQEMLRRVFPGEDANEVRLTSSLPVDYPEIIRRYDELKTVFEVVAILLK